MSVEALTPRVREALGVSASYDAETIPAAIRRSILALLRDYNFPKALKRKVYTELTVGQQQFTLPSGFRKVLQARFHDPSALAWGDPLLRREGFVQPQANGLPKRFWLEGTKLSIDAPISQGYDKAELWLFYQSMSVEANEDWMTEDYEDVLFVRTVYWEAATMRKPEVQGAFAQLWAEKQRSLAIYLNEIEFDGLEMVMREQRQKTGERYPRLGPNVG